MTRRLNTLFLVADGGRARWVKRRTVGKGFVSFKHIEAPEVEGAAPQGVVFASAAGARFTVEGRADSRRKAHARFAGHLAEELNEAVQNEGVSRIVIVAPARVNALISQGLAPGVAAKIAGVLDKDLSKVPDEQLTAWLAPLDAD